MTSPLNDATRAASLRIITQDVAMLTAIASSSARAAYATAIQPIDGGYGPMPEDKALVIAQMAFSHAWREASSNGGNS